MRIKANNEVGFYDLIDGGIINIAYPTSKTKRGRVQDNGRTSPTVSTFKELAIMENVKEYRIRRLTERECLRLMDVSEEDIDKILKAVSPSQAYKQAGNSIVVSVMVYIFDNLFNDKDELPGQMTIYDYL